MSRYDGYRGGDDDRRDERRGDYRRGGGGGGYRGGYGGGGYGEYGVRRGGGTGTGAGGGAEHLARIHGTEEDRVNCPFYFKIGACRHGDRCSRLHNKPVFSQTILISHMYQNPLSQIIAQNGDISQLNQKQADEEFEEFFEEVYEELGNYGEVEELNVCDNLGDHLVGNVYAKFADEEHADKAQKALYGRFYAGRPLVCEFSPVTDFREARCRQFDEGTCNRGGYCNFMHIKKVPRSLLRELERKKSRSKRKSRSRSPSKSVSRSRSKSPSRSRRRSRSPKNHKSSSPRRRRSRSRSRTRRNDSRSPRRPSKGKRSASRSRSPARKSSRND